MERDDVFALMEYLSTQFVWFKKIMRPMKQHDRDDIISAWTKVLAKIEPGDAKEGIEEWLANPDHPLRPKSFDQVPGRLRQISRFLAQSRRRSHDLGEGGVSGLRKGCSACRGHQWVYVSPWDARSKEIACSSGMEVGLVAAPCGCTSDSRWAYNPGEGKRAVNAFELANLALEDPRRDQDVVKKYLAQREQAKKVKSRRQEKAKDPVPLQAVVKQTQSEMRREKMKAVPEEKPW